MKTNSISEKFGSQLALFLGEKINEVYPHFQKEAFVKTIEKQISGKTYSQRLFIFSETLKHFLPESYPEALSILMHILGDENPNQTGMFTHYYWLLPISKFVEMFGLNHFTPSIQAIEAITKRCTGEFAIRPFIKEYPTQTLTIMKQWAYSENFHLRRLSSEGLRPKLPWATQLSLFIEHPQPVFEILEILKEDSVLFVKKSVANHLTDYLKVNKKAVLPLLNQWKHSKNEHTQWIVKRATRKFSEAITPY